MQLLWSLCCIPWSQILLDILSQNGSLFRWVKGASERGGEVLRVTHSFIRLLVCSFIDKYLLYYVLEIPWPVSVLGFTQFIIWIQIIIRNRNAMVGTYKSVWAAITKYHRLGGLNNRHLFLIVLEAGSPRSGCWLLWFLACGWQPSCRVLTWQIQSSGVFSFSYKGTNPTMGALASRPHLTLIISQRPSLQIPSYWRLGLFFFFF